MSPLSLLHCAHQVLDMGGWLNPSHPLFHVVEWWSGGAYEAFLERMLLGVMLVRDVVEKSRWVLLQDQSWHGDGHLLAAGLGEAMRCCSGAKLILVSCAQCTLALLPAHIFVLLVAGLL
jgi:hypothetical protein